MTTKQIHKLINQIPNRDLRVQLRDAIQELINALEIAGAEPDQLNTKLLGDVSRLQDEKNALREALDTEMRRVDYLRLRAVEIAQKRSGGDYGQEGVA